jgi:glyoxylase-like metal-dependent hydrolase (beta-lactamase superfamily II)
MAAVERLEVQVTHLPHHACAPGSHRPSRGARAPLRDDRRRGSGRERAGAEPVGHGEIIETGDLSIEALRTPGHSPGMLAFAFNGEVCFTGDTLFAGSSAERGMPSMISAAR